jgi:hypothetical protein
MLTHTKVGRNSITMIPLSILVITITITVAYTQVMVQAESSGLYLTYTDPTFGYLIEYPSDWTISHIDSTTYISTPDRTATLFISINSSIDQNMTTEELVNKFVEAAYNSPYAKDLSLIDRNANDYYLAGHPAARVEFMAKQFNPITGETQQRMVSLASIINGKGYSIAASAPDSKFSDFAAQFGHMLYSFSVNG